MGYASVWYPSVRVRSQSGLQGRTQVSRFWCKLSFGMILLTGWQGNLFAAQAAVGGAGNRPAAQSKTTTRVTPGNSSGTAGNSVVVPLYFTPADGVSVGRVRIEMTFVSVNLKFDKLDRGIGAEMAGLEMKSEVKAGKNEQGLETSTVIIEGGVPPSRTPKQGIAAGLLGYITLKIGEKSTPASISIRTKAEAWALGSDQPLEDITTSEAKVDVLAPGTQPSVACFFFTH